MITDITDNIRSLGDDPRQYNLTEKNPVYITDSLQPLDQSNTMLDQSDSLPDNTTLLNLIDCILYYTDKKSLSTIEATKVLNKILTLLVE